MVLSFINCFYLIKRNEKLFENLSDSNEFKDILDGIHSYYTKTKVCYFLICQSKSKGTIV